MTTANVLPFDYDHDYVGANRTLSELSKELDEADINNVIVGSEIDLSDG